jgi:hypothetical protein
VLQIDNSITAVRFSQKLAIRPHVQDRISQQSRPHITMWGSQICSGRSARLVQFIADSLDSGLWCVCLAAGWLLYPAGTTPHGWQSPSHVSQMKQSAAIAAVHDFRPAAVDQYILETEQTCVSVY